MNLNYRFVYNVFRLKNSVLIGVWHLMGRNQDFKLGGGAHLKKLRRSEGGAKIFGVFRVKNHDFTPKKTYFFPILGGGVGAPGAPPPPGSPLHLTDRVMIIKTYL
jgi:hypothetical protein